LSVLRWRGILTRLFVMAGVFAVHSARCSDSPFSIPMALAATNTDKTLYEDSIQATKQSIAEETLGIFYHDALDYYHEKRYDDALQLLDKIYSINPHYQDVESLRATIHKKMQSNQNEENLGTIHDWMKKVD